MKEDSAHEISGPGLGLQRQHSSSGIWEEPARSAVKLHEKAAWPQKSHLEEEGFSAAQASAGNSLLGVEMLATQFCLILARSISCCHLLRLYKLRAMSKQWSL